MARVIYACNSKDQITMIFSLKKYDILMSYFYLAQKKNIVDLLEFIKEQRADHESIFFLDSGAYSAWKSGKKVNLWTFIDFIKKYHQYFSHVVCLDVIDNPVLSEVNHRIMQEELKDFDLTLMPVFHSGEPFSVLDYMVEQGYKYIGISPNNNWFEKQKRTWLGQVFSRYDFDALGIHTHGFGYQSLEGVQRYPLTTCDAATWNLAAGYGRIMDPLVPSVRYSDRAIGMGDHIGQIPGGDSEFTKALCEELGISIESLHTDYLSRRLFNVQATHRIMEEGEKKVMPVHVSIWDDEHDMYGIPFNLDLLEESYQKAKALGKEYEGDQI